MRMWSLLGERSGSRGTTGSRHYSGGQPSNDVAAGGLMEGAAAAAGHSARVTPVQQCFPVGRVHLHACTAASVPADARQ